MTELMEPTTYILNPRSTELQSLAKWNGSPGIKNFLRATQHLSLGKLKKVSFLPNKIKDIWLTENKHDFLPKEPLAK